MQTIITQPRQKPGPKPKDGPKVESKSYGLRPVDRAAITWFARERGAESESEALRNLIDIAMSLTLGSDWAEKVEAA